MTKGFFTPQNRRLLNPAILKAISSIRTYLRFRQISCGGRIRTSPEEFEFFYMRHCAVEYDLLSLPFDGTLATLTPLQNAVRLTLFVFGFATYTRFEPSSAYTLAIVDQLKQELDRVGLATLWTSDLALWTLFFGAHISRHTKERAWFVTHLARNIGKLGLTSPDEMQEVLGRFFFLKIFTQASLLEIWDEARAVEQEHSPKELPNNGSEDSTNLAKIPPILKVLSTGAAFLAWDPYPVRG